MLYLYWDLERSRYFTMNCRVQDADWADLGNLPKIRWI